jgi:hypothetical protein
VFLLLQPRLLSGGVYISSAHTFSPSLNTSLTSTLGALVIHSADKGSCRAKEDSEQLHESSLSQILPSQPRRATIVGRDDASSWDRVFVFPTVASLPKPRPCMLHV